MKREYLKVENGIKSSGGYDVLCGINLQLFSDEINGIVSSDQREITCLLNILSGEENFDYGHIFINGEMINAYGEMKALQDKVVVVDRTSRLVEHLTLAENIYVVRGKNSTLFVHQEEVDAQLKLLLESFDINIKIEQLVRNLSELERYKIELIKAYIIGYEIVLMDMRLNNLSMVEMEELFVLIEKLKVRHLTFVVIDNVIPQIMHYADTLTIVNYGKTVRILDKKQFDEKLIYQLLTDKYIKKSKMSYAPKGDRPVIQLINVSNKTVQNIHISIKSGEVVTIICEKAVDLNHLLEILKGETTERWGRILLNGKIYKPNGIEEAIHLGVGFIENNPLEDVLFQNLTIFDNVCMIKGSSLKSLWWKKRYRKSIRQEIINTFGRDLCDSNLSELSGLEIQKVVYYRWVLYNPSLMIIVKPFSTGDMNMCEAAEELILEFAKRGIAVLILTQNELTLGRMGGRKLILKEHGFVEYLRNKWVITKR